jgi:hypothetical protein
MANNDAGKALLNAIVHSGIALFAETLCATPPSNILLGKQ